MKTILFAALFFLSTRCCAQVDFFRCPTSGKTEFAEHASLKPRSYPDTGNALVFKFQQDYDCPNAIHDELSTRLVWQVPGTPGGWQVPAGSDSFDISFRKEDSATALVSF